VLALLAGELLLRAGGQSYYWAIAKRPDPVLGWRPPPHSAAWQRFEGAALVETNALGFRDRDHAESKPAGTLRVAVLGDSFTEAVQVPLAQTWWRLLGDRLRTDCNPGGEIEVLNFAVSGYSTAQALLAWRTYARRYSPDLAILAFFIGNDLTENLPALDAEPLRPYLLPGAGAGAGAGVLALDDAFLQSDAYLAATSPGGRARQWLLERSRIAQLWVQARDAGRLRRLAAAGRADAGSALEPQEPGVNNGIYRPPADADWALAWAATEAMLGAFAEEARAAGAEPVLMLIGTGAQVHPDAGTAARFAAALGVDDLGYPVRRLLGVAARAGLPVVNLPALLAEQAERDGALLHGLPGARAGFGHWNAAGHRAAAEATAALACELLPRASRAAP
jgi:hypothetical protein